MIFPFFHGIDIDKFKRTHSKKKNIVKTFQDFIEHKVLFEQEGAAPPPADAGAPPATPTGDMGMPPMGGPDLGAAGMGMPPIGGGLGGPGLGGPSLSPSLDAGMGVGGPTGSPVAKKLKAYNVWDVLEELLMNKSKETNSEK
jgi:hypothetical protein